MELKMELVLVLVLSAVLVSSSSGGEDATGSRRKKVLSFGGNGMIGSEVMHLMAQEEGAYDVTLVSRGNWHFDSAERYNE